MGKTFNGMSLNEAILGRRSVREYTSKKVDTRSIRSLIEAAVKAPTAMHSEPWGFAIIQDVNMLKELSDIAKPMFIKQFEHDAQDLNALNKPEFNIFYDASTLIVICANKDSPYAIADCWLAAENLMLAARGMELGSCVIGMALLALNNKQEKLKLDISDNYEVVAPIVIGFPRKQPVVSQRKKPFILSWIEA